jgi:hypothetical protein
MGSEKYFSQIEGYEDCFVEVSDKWNVKEMRELADSEEKQYFELFKTKVVAMFLKDENGKEFTNPREFVPEDLLNFDVSIAGFIGSILPIHVRKRRNLGGMSVRPSSTSKDGPGSPTNK